MSFGLVTQKRCLNCGTALRSGARFCPRCGRAAGGELFLDETPAPVTLRPASSAAWDHVRPLAWLFLTYLGTSLVLGFSARAENSTSIIHWFMAVDAMVTAAFCAAFYREIKPLFVPHLPSVASLAQASLMGAAFVFTAFIVFTSLAAMGVPFEAMSEPYLLEGASLPTMFIAMSLAPAFWEELAFRGVIQTRLQRVLSEREAWLVQAGLFSVLHLSPLIFITHFGMGLMFGWMRNRYGSIYPGMLLHATWNGLVLMDELKGWTSQLIG